MTHDNSDISWWTYNRPINGFMVLTACSAIGGDICPMYSIEDGIEERAPEIKIVSAPVEPKPNVQIPFSTGIVISLGAAATAAITNPDKKPRSRLFDFLRRKS